MKDGAGRGGRVLRSGASTSLSYAEAARRPHPPVGCVRLQAPRAAALAARGRSEQPEAGRARARHARQQAAGRRPQRREHVRDHRLQRDRWRFEIVALRRKASTPARRASRIDRDDHVRQRSGCRRRSSRKRREHVLGRHARRRGLTSTAGKSRQLERRRQHLADAAHHPRARIEADRHVGAGRARRRHQRADRRARGGSPAPAAAAPPPHRPSRRRARPRPAAACQREAAEPQTLDPLRKRARRLEHQIVGDCARRRARSGRAPSSASARARRKRQPVADIGEHHQAFDLMIAVGAPAEDVQRQIDLGGRERGSMRAEPARCDRASRLQSAVARLLRGLVAASVGGAGLVRSARCLQLLLDLLRVRPAPGLRSRACAHWNVASSVRPTFQ